MIAFAWVAERCLLGVGALLNTKVQIGLIAQELITMQVHFEVKLLAVVKKQFEGREGEHVEYDECYFLNELPEGKDVIKINTKQDFSRFEGRAGILTVEVDTTGTHKPRLIGFVVS